VLGPLTETTVFLTLGGETTGLAVLVNGVADPVDSGVPADCLVRGAAERGDAGRGLHRMSMREMGRR
jgi:hypothetical protein